MQSAKLCERSKLFIGDKICDCYAKKMRKMLLQEDKNLTLRRELIQGTMETAATLCFTNTAINAIRKICSMYYAAYTCRFFAGKENLSLRRSALLTGSFCSPYSIIISCWIKKVSIASHAAVYCLQNIGIISWSIPTSWHSMSSAIIPLHFRSMRIPTAWHGIKTCLKRWKPLFRTRSMPKRCCTAFSTPCSASDKAYREPKGW